MNFSNYSISFSFWNSRKSSKSSTATFAKAADTFLTYWNCDIDSSDSDYLPLDFS